MVFSADNGGINKGNNHPMRGHKHDPVSASHAHAHSPVSVRAITTYRNLPLI